MTMIDAVPKGGYTNEDNKKIICVVCVVSLIANLIITNASGDMHIDTEEMTISNRVPILTITQGSEEGQVGYGGSEQFGYTGPESFVVENGVIFVLDTVNRRVLIYGSEGYGCIDISAVPKAKRMKYQDGKIAVVDNTYGVTGVYSIDGTQLALISHPAYIVDAFVSELVEIGDSYVIWKTYENELYQYDWIEKTIESLDEEMVLEIQVSDDANAGVTSVANVSGTSAWQIDSENKLLNMHGVQGGSLVYEQYENVPDVDMFFIEFSIRKVEPDGSETYAILDFSAWRSYPMEPTYLSSDGEVYVMECFEHNTVISKVVMGTTDVSKMAELEAQAEARRAEVASIEASAEVTGVDISEVIYSGSRVTAKARAVAMMDYTWTVLANHKVTSSGNVIVPAYVKNVAVGTEVTGIPYCWGGYNGYSTDGAYYSFASLESSTSYTAGNTKSNVSYHTSGTIGLDCSGFVCSVYSFSSGTKYNTTSLASFGHAVDQDELKPMDFLVKAGWHVVLYAGEESGRVKKYEAVVTNVVSDTEALDGRTERNDCNVLEMVGAGYVCRSPFCVTCNQTGVPVKNSSEHFRTCSGCGYQWPGEEHNMNGTKVETETTHASTCSVCGYVGPAEAHDVNGAIKEYDATHALTCSECTHEWEQESHDDEGVMLKYASTHTYRCSVCNHEGLEEAHNKTGVKRTTSTQHAYTCSICGYVFIWSSHNTLGRVQIGIDTHTKTCSVCGYYVLTENHTYSNGKCTVCGVSE